MKKMILTAAGLVTPIGVGEKEMWDCLINNSAHMSTISESPLAYEKHSGKINTRALHKNLVDRRFRRAANISKYAMASVKLAQDDDEMTFSNTEKLALLTCVTHGALNYTEEFHTSLLTEEPGFQSPILFSDSVLNAPASNISLCFGIKGPVHTLVGSTTTAIKAFMLAAQMVNTSVVDKSIVAACEELNKLSLHYYRGQGIDQIAEGAGAVILETDAKAKAPYCIVSAMASSFIPSYPKKAIIKVIEKCLSTAGLTITDIDLVFLEPPHIKEQLFDKTACVSITPYTGNAFTVTTLWNIILSAFILKNDKVPAALIKEENKVNLKLSSPVRHIMICAVEKQGNAAAVVLSKYL